MKRFSILSDGPRPCVYSECPDGVGRLRSGDEGGSQRRGR